MTFDHKYFYKLHEFINTGQIPIGKAQNLTDWSEEVDKLLFHLIYYIDATCNPPHEGWQHIELIEPEGENNYSQFVVLPLSIPFKIKVTATVRSDGVREFLSGHPHREYEFLPF